VSDLAAGHTEQQSFRVLVVDDDPDMAGFFVRLLMQQGMQADIATDGQEAQRRITLTPPDLVLLDVMMPGVSGFDLCRRLKANEATALVPVILVTALEDQDSRVRGIEAGADDFLSKPVRREELIARVKTLRRLHETRKELESRRLAAEIKEKETILKAFSRYLSPKLAERVLAERRGDTVFRNLSDRAGVVALFADLRGFTRLSETLPVLSIVPMLNEFFTVLTEAAHEHDGTVFSMAGDSLLVGFNVPVPQPDATERAVATGRAMIQRFAPVAATWRAQFGLAVGIGVGLEAGEVVVGNVGAPSFVSYTIIGDTVNVAARLMQTALANEILIGPRASLSLQQLLGRSTALERREVVLKGKAAPVEVVSLKVAAA
jgi:DNA-binding response OmpR family regulator